MYKMEFKTGDRVEFKDFKINEDGEYRTHNFSTDDKFYKGNGTVVIKNKNYNAIVTVIHEGHVGVEYDDGDCKRTCLGFKPETLIHSWIKDGKPNWRKKYDN